MVVVIKSEETKATGILGKMWGRLKPLDARWEEGRFGQTDYLAYICQRRGDKINWRPFLKRVGERMVTVVMDKSLDLPTRGQISRFQAEGYEQLMLIQTAATVFQASGLTVARRRIGLIDLDGRHQREVLELLPLSSDIRVLTSRKDRYQTFQRQLMEEHGVPLVVTENIGQLNSCQLVLAPGGEPTKVKLGGPLLLLPGKSENQGGGRSLSGTEVLLPEPLGELLSLGVSSTDIAGAFYQLGGERELGALKVSYCVLEGRRVPVEAAGQYLAARYGEYPQNQLPRPLDSDRQFDYNTNHILLYFL